MKMTNFNLLPCNISWLIYADYLEEQGNLVLSTAYRNSFYCLGDEDINQGDDGCSGDGSGWADGSGGDTGIGFGSGDGSGLGFGSGVGSGYSDGDGDGGGDGDGYGGGDGDGWERE